MTLAEYIKEAVKTESTLNPLTKEVNERGLSSRTLHGVLGIQTELMELELAFRNMDAVNTVEEIGDVLWYLAILADEYDIREFDKEITVDDTAALNDILDMVKKTLFYGKKLDKELMVNFIKTNLNLFAEMCGDLGVTVELAMKTNINKLAIRYPDKFKEEDAENRDLEAERELLEKELSKANFNKFIQSMAPEMPNEDPDELNHMS